MDRTRLACDRCHELKVKCAVSLHGCRRCTRLGIPCLLERPILKPGRKPRAGSRESVPRLNEPIYPVLECLAPFGVAERECVLASSFHHLCSASHASRLLDHFYSSPNMGHHSRVIRRVHLLRPRDFRPTNPALLITMLCLSCHLPTWDGEPPVRDLNHGELIRLRERSFSSALKLLEPVFLAHAEPTFDDALAVLLLCTIATHDDKKHGYLPQWLSFFKFLAKQMNLDLEPEGFDDESKEERRRLWWAALIVDRHSSLSFNMRPVLVDADCHNLLRPCPDSIWLSDMPLPPAPDWERQPTGVDYEVHALDYFGIFVPLFAILGNIQEYHFMRQHQTFGTNAALVESMREATQRNLDAWEASVRRHSQDQNCDNLSARARDMTAADSLQEQHRSYPSEPKLLLYGWHIFHCFHILLYGKMDLVQMFRDTDWLLSRDFLVTAEHARHCAKESVISSLDQSITIAADILAFDPKLHMLFQLFGTYLLQSSFIFLILAKKLKHLADDYIMRCCETNLRLLDAFVDTVSISYQKTFARVLRETLSQRMSAEDDSSAAGPASGQGETFDLEVLKYRWTAGYKGLWFEDMGRPKEARMRKFDGLG